MRTALSDRRWLRPVRAMLLLALDAGAAVGVGLLILRQFQIWSIGQSDPPICANYYGDGLSCDRSDSWVPIAALGVFCIILFGSLWIERRRGWL